MQSRKPGRGRPRIHAREAADDPCPDYSSAPGNILLVALIFLICGGVIPQELR